VKDLLTLAPADAGEGDELAEVRLSDKRTVKEHLDDLVGSRIRENMRIGSFARFRPEGSFIGAYVHHNRKIACLVELEGADLGARAPARELANDLGMQIAFHAQIAEGKLAKRLKEVVLLDQPFLKDEKVSVKQRVEAVAKEAGTPIRIRRFARIGAGA
jgi:elongation factor Ts